LPQIGSPRGSPGALERVLGVIAGGCRWHGRAGPGVAGRWLTARRDKDPGAIADKTLSWKRCPANRADDVAAEDDPRTPPRAVRNQRACRHARASHADAAAHRTITITADHPFRGDARVVRITAWCGTVNDADNRIPAVAEPGKPARTRNQTKVRA